MAPREPLFSCVRRRDGNSAPLPALPHTVSYADTDRLSRARCFPPVQVETPEMHEWSTMEVGARPSYLSNEALPWWKVWPCFLTLPVVSLPFLDRRSAGRGRADLDASYGRAEGTRRPEAICNHCLERRAGNLL